MSGFILVLKLSTILEFCEVVNNTSVALAGELANIYKYITFLGYFNLDNCVFCYLISAIFQAAAIVLKQFVDKQIKTNIREQG